MACQRQSGEMDCAQQSPAVTSESQERLALGCRLRSGKKE